MTTPKANDTIASNSNRLGVMTTATSAAVAAAMSVRTVRQYSPCLACGSKLSTNRPLSYHLKKGVRKHLPSGICYRTETGKPGELPPLSTIADGSCICLACVKIIDTLLATLDKMPLRNGSQHAPIVRPLAPVKTVVKPNRRIPVTKNMNPNLFYGNTINNATTNNGNVNMNTDNNHNNIHSPIIPNHSTSIPTPSTNTTPPKSAPAVPVPVPTTGVCIICNLSSGAPSPSQPAPKVPGCPLGQIRDQIIYRVGNHLSTLESTVRIFRAARVELAEGVCTFNSRAFATHLLHGTYSENRAGIICTLHHGELLRAADVKAAGALPCAICGEKPTLSGGDEVRSLAPFIVHYQNLQSSNGNGNGNGNNGNRLCDAAMAIMKAANILSPNNQEQLANFLHHFHAFLEKEFACSQCHRALEEKL